MADYDILILGGGLVGCSLACALEGKGLRVALLEARAPSPVPPGFDERRLALAAATINALSGLGVLAKLAAPPSALRRIHVSRSGDFGSVRLEASEYGRESFGGVVSARDLGLALEARLAELADTRVLRPCTVRGIRQDAQACIVEAEHEGGPSQLRTSL